MFFDEVVLEVKGGRGGNGCMSFHREKFVPYGPPDGGDGGNGGDIKIVADENFNTFRHFSGKKLFEGGAGEPGSKSNAAGHAGEVFDLRVPVGTLVYDADTNELIADLQVHGQEVVVARGGRGGYGNSNFASSVRQAPKFAELGDIGEHRIVRLELQLVADVGLLGFPSAGKSTLISHVSAAKPKIAAYPFTTLIPNLGVVNLFGFGGERDQSFVIADMPGIIEGAAEGKGLGGQFLKHISRTAILIYLLDPFSYDGRSIVEQYRVLKHELEAYDPALVDKAALVVLNKIDAIPDEDRARLKQELLTDYPELKDQIRMISGVSGEGLKEFMLELWHLVQAQRKAKLALQAELEEDEAAPETPVYTPTAFVDDKAYNVELMYTVKALHFEAPVYGQLIQPEAMPERQLFKVTGKRIEQIVRMTNTAQEGAVERVYDVLDKMNIQSALRRAGAKTGDYVKIGPHIFEFHDLSHH